MEVILMSGIMILVTSWIAIFFIKREEKKIEERKATKSQQ
jgi:hypothetical protein